MSKRHALPILLVCGTVLASTGFFAGIELEGFRFVRAESAGAAATVCGTEEHVWPIADAKTEGRICGEFEHQAALILGVNELVQYHPETLARMVAALHDRIKILGVIANDEQRARTLSLLREHGLSEDSIDFFQWPVEAMWVRDYAPFFVCR